MSQIRLSKINFTELHGDLSRRFSYDNRMGNRELAFMIGTQEDEIDLKFTQGWAKPVKKIDCASCLTLNLCSKTCSKFKQLFLAGHSMAYANTKQLAAT